MPRAGEAGAVDADTTTSAPVRRRDDPRILYRVVATLVVVPILVATVRDGLDGWVPTFDAAHTVLRARYALGVPPHLLGIYTDASNWIDSPTYFPGPWWLWWMSIPIRVLGSIWGALLSVVLLNVAWILLAGWSVRRRLGPHAAMAALVFLGALTWSLGTSALHSPSGQVMIVPVFAAFLFIAWAVAAGDDGALPGFALITNFILLDEVVLVRIVPFVAFAALVLWGAGLVRAHTRDPEGRRRRWIRARRAALVSAASTIVLWLPSIVQEFTNDPGNLTNLWRVAKAGPTESGVWGRAFDVMISFFVHPPFWLRGSRTSNLLFYDPSPTTIVRVAAALALVAIAGFAIRSAVRRRDRPAFTAVALGAVTFVAAWINLAFPPSPTGAPTYIGHFLSLWAVAMFVTFTLGYGVVRALQRPPALLGARVAVGCAALLAVANLPHANFATGTYAAPDDVIATARFLDPLVVDAVRDRGPVKLAEPNIYTSPIVASLAVALTDADVAFCVDGVPQWSDLPVSGCASGATDVTVEVLPSAFADPPPGAKVIGRYDPLTEAERHELDELDRLVDDALATVDRLEPTAAYHDFIRSAIPPGDLRRSLSDPSFLSDPGELVDSMATRSQFAGVLANVHQLSGTRDVMLVHLRGVPDEKLLRWAELEGRRSSRSFVVIMTGGR